MLPSCSPTPSLEGGQVLTPPTSPLVLSLEAHGRETGRRIGHLDEEPSVSRVATYQGRGPLRGSQYISPWFSC